MQIPFGIQSAISRSREATTERLINCYVQTDDPRGKSKTTVYGRPGLASFSIMGGTGMRGAAIFQGAPYVLNGQTLYRISASGVATAMSGSIDGIDPVVMAAGENELLITSDSNAGYSCDNTTITQITDVDFLGGSSCAYLDGYFLFTRPNSNEWAISELLDGLSYDALDFASKESTPDNLVRVFVDHADVWLFGERSAEIWQNSGAADFPFARLGQARVERGLLGKYAITKDDNAVFWLGDNKIVYRANGYQPARISTHAVEKAIGGYAHPEQCQAFSYAFEGHTFVVFRFPGEGTWVYDAATQIWTEAATINARDWRVSFPIAAFNRNFICSIDTADFFEVKGGVYKDGEAVLQRVMISPLIQAFPNYLTMDRLELDFEGGVGATSGQGLDPLVLLSWSDDYGATWSIERAASVGRIGEYKWRAVWNRLGRFRERCFRVRFSDPCAFAILNADAVVQKSAA